MVYCLHTMTTRKIAYILAFSLVFLLAQSAYAAKGETLPNRYFIHSKASLWKNSLGVRHVFSGGFTADLSDWQLRLVKLFGVEFEPVTKLYVLDEPASIALDTDATLPGNQSGDRFVPTEAMPWGVRMMYNDTAAISNGGEDIAVAVLDTGVLKTHPDLVRRIADCKDFTSLSTKSLVVSGRCDDKNGHGTHVAGTIAADGGKDKLGMYGVAPEVSLFAYKVCNTDGVCWADDVAAAVRTAVGEGAHVINISLGSDKPSPFLAEAIHDAVEHDVLVVAAAGNDGPEGNIEYPAAYADVVAVGAVGSTEEVPDWSSRGTNEDSERGVIDEGDLEFVAPGVTIESTWKDGGYVALSGTSMAAPHISGLAAKLWKKDLTHPAAEVRSVLRKIARDLESEGEDNDSGFGIPAIIQE